MLTSSVVTFQLVLRLGQPLALLAPRTAVESSRYPAPGWLFQVVWELIGLVARAWILRVAVQSNSPVSVSSAVSVPEWMSAWFRLPMSNW